jgi:hypothetical protein
VFPQAALAYRRNLIARLGKGTFTEPERVRFAALAEAPNAPSAAERVRLVRGGELALTAVSLGSLMEETGDAE